jgi:hypothetical protein
MFDGGGLYLAVQPSGSKLWRLKYRYGGMESVLSFGAHPATSLASARRKREQARQLLATGQDPRLELSREAISQTFEAAARLWHDILVVEYKGAHLTDAADTDEKRAIGALWEKASGGKGLFLMAEKQADGKDVRGQLLAKVG